MLFKRALSAKIGQHLGCGKLRFSPEFSGRTALIAAAELARANGALGVAHVPDYICNVVPMALEIAGFTVQSYRTDDKNEPDTDELERLIRANQGGLLITASVYGSSACLEWLNLQRVQDLISERGWHVVADLCQDHALVQKLPFLGNRLSAIVSFNRKRVPGIMGGGILSDTPPAPARHLRMGETVALLRFALLRWLRPPTRQPAAHSYDFSDARNFPFDLVRREPSLLQLLVANWHLHRIDRFRRRKARALRAFAPSVVDMPNLETAPYVIWRHKTAPADLLRKPPYSLPHQAGESLRPDLVVIHNKGFDDTARS